MVESDALLLVLDDVVLELYDGTTDRTDQMVVVVVADEFEARRTSLKVALCDDAAVLQHSQCSVHRGCPDAGVSGTHFAQELLCRDVSADGCERLKDQLAPGRALQLVA